MDLFFHDEVKQIFLDENTENPKNQEIINALSEPAYEKRLHTLESPRLIKTHIPISLLPKGVIKTTPKVKN